MPKSGETTAQQLKDLVAASDTSGEEPNILLRFVCSGKEGKKPERRNFVNTVSRDFSSDSGESLFTVQLTPERESVHAVQSTLPFKISTYGNEDHGCAGS